MSNGQIIIAAMTNYGKVEFFKTDSTGVELTGWPKSFNANNQMGVHQDLNRMAFTYNGTHVIGAVQDYQQNNRVRIFTFNPATGTLGQDTLIGASNVDIQPRAVISSGSKVYVTGYSNPNNEYKEFVAAWDTAAGANGNWLVNNIDMSPGAQGGHTCGIALSIKNGDLYVLGQGWIQNVGWHMELRKLSSTGSTLWSKQYVGDGDMSNSERASVINLTSGQFFITSQMRATWRSSRNDNYNYLTYFARVNADGTLNKMKFRLGVSNAYV